MNIYVFKTSIKPRDIETVNAMLLSLIPTSKWNYDLEDCDNILRIESTKDVVALVCSQLSNGGFYCEELE
ncbi:MAG: hypothetical protein AAGA85_18190 [Bacteroidota bacterium]